MAPSSENHLNKSYHSTYSYHIKLTTYAIMGLCYSNRKPLQFFDLHLHSTWANSLAPSSFTEPETERKRQDVIDRFHVTIVDKRLAEVFRTALLVSEQI